MSDAWINAFTNQGIAVAMAMLFLWHSVKRGEKSDELAKDLIRRQEIDSEANREHNKQIALEYRSSIQRLFDGLQAVVSDHIEVTRANVAAVAKLEGAVDSLRAEVSISRKDQPPFTPTTAITKLSKT